MPAEITHPTDELVRAVCTECFWCGPAIPAALCDHADQAVEIHNGVMHPVETGVELAIGPADETRLRVIFTAANRWRPPTDARESMNIHADVRTRLRAFCNETMAGTGVGYSEFIMAALDAHERGDWSIADAKPAKPAKPAA